MGCPRRRRQRTSDIRRWRRARERLRARGGGAGTKTARVDVAGGGRGQALDNFGYGTLGVREGCHTVDASGRDHVRAGEGNNGDAGDGRRGDERGGEGGGRGARGESQGEERNADAIERREREKDRRSAGFVHGKLGGRSIRG